MLAVAMGKDEIMKYIDDMVRVWLATCNYCHHHYYYYYYYYSYWYHHHYQLILLLFYDDLCVC